MFIAFPFQSFVINSMSCRDLLNISDSFQEVPHIHFHTIWEKHWGLF